MSVEELVEVEVKLDFAARLEIEHRAAECGMTVSDYMIAAVRAYDPLRKVDLHSRMLAAMFTADEWTTEELALRLAESSADLSQ